MKKMNRDYQYAKKCAQGPRHLYQNKCVYELSKKSCLNANEWNRDYQYAKNTPRRLYQNKCVVELTNKSCLNANE